MALQYVALGQLQTFPEPERMSALPPEADIRDAHCHVCFGPFAVIRGNGVREGGWLKVKAAESALKSGLLDQLIDSGKEVWWQGDTERLGCPGVDRKLEPSWLH